MGYAVGQVANLPNKVEAGSQPVEQTQGRLAIGTTCQRGMWRACPENSRLAICPTCHRPRNALLADYRQRTELNRKILDHLLHDAFSGDPQTRAEVDLVLDPDPPEEHIESVLSRYRFRDAARRTAT